MLRTEETVRIIDSFVGVNDAVDEFKLDTLSEHLKMQGAWVRRSDGGRYTERGEFERLMGKKVMSTSTAFGCLLGLRQLEFRDRMVVIIHSSNVYQAETDLYPLRVSAPPITSTLMDSFMVP